MKKYTLLFFFALAFVGLNGQVLHHPLPISKIDADDGIWIVRANEEKVIFDAQSTEYGYDLFVYDVATEEVTPLNIDPCRNNTAVLMALEIFANEAYAMIVDSRWVSYVKIDLDTKEHVVLRKLFYQGNQDIIFKFYFSFRNNVFHKFGDDVYIIDNLWHYSFGIWKTDGTVNGTKQVADLDYSCEYYWCFFCTDMNNVFDITATATHLYFTAGVVACSDLYRYNIETDRLENLTDSISAEGVSNLDIYNGQPFFSIYPDDKSVWTIHNDSLTPRKVIEQPDLRSARHFAIVNDHILFASVDKIRSINLKDNYIAFEEDLGSEHRAYWFSDQHSDTYVVSKDQSFAYILTTQNGIHKTTGDKLELNFSTYDAYHIADYDVIHARLIPDGLIIEDRNIHVTRSNGLYQRYNGFGAVSGDKFYSFQNLVAHDMITNIRDTVIRLNNRFDFDLALEPRGHINDKILFRREYEANQYNIELVAFDYTNPRLQRMTSGLSQGNKWNDQQAYFLTEDNIGITDGTKTGTEIILETAPFTDYVIHRLTDDLLLINTLDSLFVYDNLNKITSLGAGNYRRFHTPVINGSDNDLLIFYADNKIYKIKDDLSGLILLVDEIEIHWYFQQSQYHDGILYFGADDSQGDFHLWRTDGTPEGTRIFLNEFQSKNVDGTYFSSTDQGLYFLNNDSLNCLKNPNASSEIVSIPVNNQLDINLRSEIITFRKSPIINTRRNNENRFLRLDEQSNKLEGIAFPRAHVIESHYIMDTTAIIFIVDGPRTGKELWYYNYVDHTIHRLFDLHQGAESGVNSGIQIIDKDIYFLGKSSTSNSGIWKYSFVDADGDGYPFPLDCNDNNRNVYPGKGNCETTIDPKDDLDLLIYPNPGTEVIYLEMKRWSNRETRIYNQSGTLMYENSSLISPNFSIDVSQYPTGQYFVEVIDKDSNTRSMKSVLIFNN